MKENIKATIYRLSELAEEFGALIYRYFDFAQHDNS